MSYFLKDFFVVNNSQKKGYFVFIIILLLIILFPYIYREFFFKPEVYDFSKDKKEIESFILSIENKNSEVNDNKIDFTDTEIFSAKAKLKPFNFNPNNLPADLWLKMGFTENQVKSIKKYEQKGGKFYTKQDVKKMWVISPEEYFVIEPFILLPDSMTVDRMKSVKESFPEREFSIVEINSADTTKLKELPGIGSVLAARIVNYKSKLGGFYSKEQLLEVWGVDSSKYILIEPLVDINIWLIRKININEASFESLRKHPYITNNVAISIYNYRNRHGEFNVIEDVMNSELIDGLLFKKLAPYLTVE